MNESSRPRGLIPGDGVAWRKLNYFLMKENQWSTIPTTLMATGFSVAYERISYEPQHPLWRARASRDGRQWNALGENLGAAFQELGKQTKDVVRAA